MIDLNDSAAIAAFLLALGYERDETVNAVAQRGNLCISKACAIVDEAIAANRQATTEGGQHGAD